MKWLSAVLLLAFVVATPVPAQFNEGGLIRSASTISGTVRDELGALIPGVVVELFNTNTGQRFVAFTNFEGQYRFSGLVTGIYKIRVSLDGFAVKEVDQVTIGLGQSAPLDIQLSTGGSTPGPTHLTFKDPVWNVWAEAYSSTPAYWPVAMQPDTDYSVVLDLAALRFADYDRSAIYSHDVSATFTRWLERNKTLTSANVDIIILPDRRYFAVQASGEKVKSLHIDLAKLRKAQKHGFELKRSPLAILQGNAGSAPFSFGVQCFRVRTRARTGQAPISFSIWVNGKPIDELTASFCIGADVKHPCSPTAPVVDSLSGVDLSGRRPLPDAALHLFDRGSEIVGVYRCNTCGWKSDDFKVWHIEQSGSWFVDRAREILDLMTQTPDPASGVTTLQMFDHAGDNIRNVIFQSTDPDVPLVALSLAKLVEAGRSKSSDAAPPSIFVRLLPTEPTLALVPLNLLRVEMSSHAKEYLGAYADIQTPLEFQDYSVPSACLSRWALFVPPAVTPVPPALQAVSDARSAFSTWIDAFRRSCPACVMENETSFGRWLGDTASNDSTAIVTLSHHGTNSLFFYDGGSPAIQSSAVTRRFASPSLAILAACGTSRPGASEFMRRFNELGVSSVIATSTEVDPTMAGRFLTLFLDLLRKHANDRSRYTVGRARFDAARALSTLNDSDGKPYGARALSFVLAGNGSLRACVPPEQTKP